MGEGPGQRTAGLRRWPQLARTHCFCMHGRTYSDVHGPHGAEVLVDDTRDVAATLAHVAQEPPDEARVGVGVHKDLNVEQISELVMREDEDPLDEDDRARHHVDGLRLARVRAEVVLRHLDLLTAQQRLDVLEQQLRVERVGVVKVALLALLRRQVRQVLVVVVVADERDVIRTKRLEDGRGQRRLARSAPAADRQHHRARALAGKGRRERFPEPFPQRRQPVPLAHARLAAPEVSIAAQQHRLVPRRAMH
mmetsp:Transcript_43711/g.137262  ORF Transcript_43711/g.137262 Transcript_43711/m.137262 type:complete len:251 (-) Transcript_43711:387-1139(-)